MKKSTLMRVSLRFKDRCNRIKKAKKNEEGIELYDSEVTNFILREMDKSHLDFEKIKIDKSSTSKKRKKKNILDMELKEIWRR